jgi:hypothetical protein
MLETLDPHLRENEEPDDKQKENSEDREGEKELGLELQSCLIE